MPKSVDRIAGFDWLRVLALGLVLVFHILVLVDRNEWTRVAGISIGALGVSMFFGISGALIGVDSSPSVAWLWSRLKKIYPAYWVATILAFLAAGVSGYKQVSLIQFLWQMSGIGLSYIEDLINVATWFIGLLLPLYFSVFLARLTPYSQSILRASAIVAAILVVLDSSAGYFANCAIFYGAILVFKTQKPIQSLLSLCVLCALLSMFHSEFLSAALVWLLLGFGLCIKQLPTPIVWVSRYSYEFYLLHGLFLVGFMRLFKAQGLSVRSSLAMLVGILATSVASVIIQVVLNKVLRKVEAKYVGTK